jgi:cellulose synthase/poly-beta-1,6-N-acetylglucosamine synthase-like glycosyltransferase
MDMADYERNDINDYDSVFVIDEYGEAELHEVLLRDLVSSTRHEVVWAGFHADKLERQLRSEKGITPGSREPRASSPIAVTYKGLDFSADGIKVPSQLPGMAALQENTRVLATSEDEKGLVRPLIIDIDDRYLILPFEVPYYYHNLDSYTTVFLSVLHNTFGHVKSQKRVLVRLEDVNAHTYENPRKLDQVYQFLKSRDIPFHIALIPRYKNPPAGIDLDTQDRPRFARLLRRVVGEGLGTIVLHGYTHQTGNQTSGIGFEFWDSEKSAPLVHESDDFVIHRATDAQEAMRKARLPVSDVWETPHYALSMADSESLDSVFPLRYEHIPAVGSLPFVAQVDGTIYFPENLGFVIDPTHDIPAIEENLERLSVFDAPVASFFWHPWRDIGELEQLVDLFERRGYEFVSIYDLVDYTGGDHYLEVYRRDYLKSPEYVLFVRWKPYTLAFFYICFSLGTVRFLRTRHQLNKHYKTLKSPRYTLSTLACIARNKNSPLPRIAIFVPARNEGYVIGNTVRRLARLDYPKDRYQVVVIVDERELDDDVDLYTKDVVAETAARLHEEYGVEFIHVVEVPKWYSGVFGSWKHTFERSTKGRALNYALQCLRSDPQWNDTEMVGVLDADGRLSIDVLKEVAHKRLTSNCKLVQGPVLQCSNFDQVSLVGIAAGLELAIHHLTELASRLYRGQVQFLAGTNYFIDKELLCSVGAWDQHALVDDAELALRIYVRSGQIAQWHSCPEMEQTPASFAVYRKQRERWVRGHLSLIGPIATSSIPFLSKLHFLWIIFVSQFRFLIDVGLPVLAWALLALGFFRDLSLALQMVSLFQLVVSILFIDSYGYMYRKISSYIAKDMSLWQKTVASIKLGLFVPVLVLMKAIPRLDALYNYTVRANKVGWYKTERTREVVVENA